MQLSWLDVKRNSFRTDTHDEHTPAHIRIANNSTAT